MSCQFVASHCLELVLGLHVLRSLAQFSEWGYMSAYLLEVEVLHSDLVHEVILVLAVAVGLLAETYHEQHELLWWRHATASKFQLFVHFQR